MKDGKKGWWGFGGSKAKQDGSESKVVEVSMFFLSSVQTAPVEEKVLTEAEKLLENVPLRNRPPRRLDFQVRVFIPSTSAGATGSH